MDTWCNQTIPVHTVESETATHRALFQSTLPTGITNSFMMGTAKHPVYAAAITKLPASHAMTQFWVRLQPYCAIMISAGPMFLTLVVKDYLLKQPSLASPTVGVINATELAPYTTNIESGTWHRADANVFMWIGDKPWIWFGAGTIVLVSGLCILDYVLISIFRRQPWKVATHGLKLAKVT